MIGQGENGADDHHRHPHPPLRGEEGPHRGTESVPPRPQHRRQHGAADHRDEEKEARVPVNQEPAGQRHYPCVPHTARRHRCRRDDEGKVGRHVQVRHPVGAEHGRVHGREGHHDREAGRRAAQRPGPAVSHADDEGHEHGVQRVCGEQLAVPRGRDHVQPRPEQGFAGRLDVHVRGPGMMKVVPGVVSDQKCEVPGLLDQDRVRAHVRVLIQPCGEQEPVTDAQQPDQHRCRRRYHPPPTGTARTRRGAAGSGRRGWHGRIPLLADAHPVTPLPRDAVEQVPVPDQDGVGAGVIDPGRDGRSTSGRAPAAPSGS